MASGNFLLSWWYTSETKLGIYGSGFGISQNNLPVAALPGSRVTSEKGLAASLEEGYRFSSVITEHPVQSGLNIADSIILQPLVVEITGVLSAIKPVKLGGVSLTSKLDFSTLGGAVNTLISLYNKKTGISLTTGLYFGGLSYFRTDNMAIEELYIPRTSQYGVASVKFEMVLKQIILTSPNGLQNSVSYSNGLPYGGNILPL